MTAFPKLSASLVFAGAAAFAAPVLADQVVEVQTVTIPGTTGYVYTPSDDSYVATTDYYYQEPRVTVIAPTEDEAITADVVDRIARDPRVDGTIGVETYQSDVTLTGRVGTPFQRELAEQDAHSVDGVGDVQNLLRLRVGEM